jgi:hypothetical protein
MTSRNKECELMGSLNQKTPAKNKAARLYTLIQIPELLLVLVLLVWIGEWLDLNRVLVYMFLTAWIIKDIVLFFLVWPAYVRQAKTVHESMIGSKGVTIETLDPKGYIALDGELWQAELIRPHRLLAKGRPVRVVAGSGLLLKVAPGDVKREQYAGR